MKSISVTGYIMTKNHDTWEMEKTGDLITVEVSSRTDDPEFVEGLASKKLNSDWFEAVTMQIN